MDEQITADVYVEQVREGWEYKGHVDFHGVVKFDYHFVLPSEMEIFDRDLVKDAHVALNRVRLNVTNAKGIDITQRIGDGKMLFFSATIPLAMDLYDNPQSKSANQTYVAGGTGCLMLKDYGASAKIGMSRKLKFKRTLKLEELFATAK